MSVLNHNCYIQGLFPERKHGLNDYAHMLFLSEIEIMKNDEQLLSRSSIPWKPMQFSQSESHFPKPIFLHFIWTAMTFGRHHHGHHHHHHHNPFVSEVVTVQRDAYGNEVIREQEVLNVGFADVVIGQSQQVRNVPPTCVLPISSCIFNCSSGPTNHHSISSSSWTPSPSWTSSSPLKHWSHVCH